MKVAPADIFCYYCGFRIPDGKSMVLAKYTYRGVKNIVLCPECLRKEKNEVPRKLGRMYAKI